VSNEIEGFFRVEKESDKYVFLSLKLPSINELPNSIFEYFFSEQVLWRHIKYRTPEIPFEPNKHNYHALYLNLLDLLDSDSALPRGDKKGKIGELFLSVLLEQYFACRCVIPKSSLLSSKNMSVHGIDADYFMPDDNCFLFGESKVTKSLEGGIAQANLSLNDYEQSISNEYRILSKKYLEGVLPDEITAKLDVFYQEGNGEEVAAPFQRVCQVLGINTIGVAVFICHGTETSVDGILHKLDRIKRTPVILGMQTKYYVISMPVGDKDSFINGLTDLIRQKAENYGRQR